MPILELTYPTGAFGPDVVLQTLASELTTIVLRAEKAPDTESARLMTLVHFHELPAARTYTAGVQAKDAAFVLRVTVPQGAVSLRRNQRLIAEATQAIGAATRTAPTVRSARVIVLISEVTDGFLGLDGRAVSLPELARMAAGPSGTPSKLPPAS